MKKAIEMEEEQKRQSEIEKEMLTDQIARQNQAIKFILERLGANPEQFRLSAN
jgi:hypothetical protein